ncbi:hypothetical protein Agub_g5947, partial [Astrephomene gubernaculifera]
MLHTAKRAVGSLPLQRIPFRTLSLQPFSAANTNFSQLSRSSSAFRMYLANNQARALNPRLATPALSAAFHQRMSTATKMPTTSANNPAVQAALGKSTTVVLHTCKATTATTAAFGDASVALTDVLTTLKPATTAPSPSSGPSEQPTGMVSEAALLAAFSDVPIVSSAVVRAGAAAAASDPGSGGVSVTVQLQQRNLPSNSQRRYSITAG